MARQPTTGSDDLKRRPCSEIHEAMKRTGVRRGASRRAPTQAARIDAATANAARSGRQILQRYDPRSRRETNEFLNEYDARHRRRAFTLGP
ncbi:hypothetical protein DF038_13685 [Burkholderia cepacia]|nr:hypothetical protein DF038_13685 [Burkholderia cepacia]